MSFAGVETPSSPNFISHDEILDPQSADQISDETQYDHRRHLHCCHFSSFMDKPDLRSLSL